MDLASMGIAGVAVITTICYLIGEIVKVCGVNNKYVPCVVGIAGAVLGMAGMVFMPEFPATDCMTAVAVGIVSGLAATGVNQITKQLGGQ